MTKGGMEDPTGKTDPGAVRSLDSVETVGIVGLGLIGGSLARALKEAPGGSGRPAAGSEAPRIVASTLDRGDLDRAVREGVVDRGVEDAAEVASEADLLVYATPLDATLVLLEAHRDRIRSDAVVTDVVSLKLPVARKIRELGLQERWVGGHPMAGSEQSGFGAARSDLFRGAPVFLVRGDARGSAAGVVESLWIRARSEPRWVDAEAHDRRMIWASHLPPLVANALAACLEEAGVSPEDLGPGGRDMTRLAASTPELWKGLLKAGGSGEIESLESIIAELEEITRLLSVGDSEAMEDYMEATRRWREGEDRS